MIIMKQLHKWRYLLLSICLSLLIGIFYLNPLTAVGHSVTAQSNFKLDSDIISLRARVSRLEQEVNRLRSIRPATASPSRQTKQPTPAPRPRPTVVNPPIVNGRAIGKSDPLYERLATLLIELKEDVRDIDRRLSAIERANTQP